MATRKTYGFRLYLHQVGPIHDPDFNRAPDSLKRALLRAVVQFGLEEKDKDLAAGLDVNGETLIPIKQKTRDNRRSEMGHADPNAPPLTPAYGLSRTRSLLDGRANKDHAEFFWRYDDYTQKPWSRILDYHRTGAGPLPVRNVIGASPAMIGRVRTRTLALWQSFKRGGPLIPAPNPAIVERKAIEAIPPNVARSTFRVLPAYVPKNPLNAIPKANKEIVSFEIDGNIYTMGGSYGSDRSVQERLESIRKRVEAGTFKGFKQHRRLATR